MTYHNHHVVKTQPLRDPGECPACDENRAWSPIRDIIARTIRAQANHPLNPEMDASEIVQNLKKAGITASVQS